MATSLARARIPVETSYQEPSVRYDAGQLGVAANGGQTKPEATSVVSWTDLNGYGRDKIQQQDDAPKHAASRLGEEPDDGGEPPDNRKDTYGSADVE